MLQIKSFSAQFIENADICDQGSAMTSMSAATSGHGQDYREILKNYYRRVEFEILKY